MEELDFVGIPDHILHTFACDCAERALQIRRHRGREPDKTLWKVIEVKRQWLNGEATTQQVRDAHDAAWHIICTNILQCAAPADAAHL